MIAVLFAIVIATAAGLPLVLLLRNVRLERRGIDRLLLVCVPEGLLFGFGIATLWMLLLSTLHVTWSRVTLLVPLAAAAAIAWRAALRLTPALAPTVAIEDRAARASPLQRMVALLAYAATAASLLGYTLYATIAPLWEFDFLSDWGLKARVFFESGGVDWLFLERAFHQNVHADYPLLLPLTFDFAAVLHGGWDDRAIGLLNVMFALVVLAAAHGEFRASTSSRLWIALGTFGVVSFAASPWIGIAESPFVAYATTGVLAVRRGVQHASGRDMTAGALLLGFSASVKNEGLTLIAAVAIALLACGAWRSVARLWPALAIPLPWLLLRATHRLSTDLAAGSIGSRVAEHLRNPLPLITALTEYPGGKPLLWLGIGLAIVATSRELARRERFALVALLAQFAFYIAAYVITPHDVEWHVKWSWERIVSHLTPLLVIVLLANLFMLIERRGLSEAVEASPPA